MADGGLCPEHVWDLAELRRDSDGRMSQVYGCQRCPEQLLVGPDDLPPGSPDFPFD